MNQTIEKELLLARLHYLEAINDKPGNPQVHPQVIQKVKEYIMNGRLETYMGMESLFNYLREKLPENESRVDHLAEELIAFIDQ